MLTSLLLPGCGVPPMRSRANLPSKMTRLLQLVRLSGVKELCDTAQAPVLDRPSPHRRTLLDQRADTLV